MCNGCVDATKRLKGMLGGALLSSSPLPSSRAAAVRRSCCRAADGGTGELIRGGHPVTPVRAVAVVVPLATSCDPTQSRATRTNGLGCQEESIFIKLRVSSWQTHLLALPDMPGEQGREWAAWRSTSAPR